MNVLRTIPQASPPFCIALLILWAVSARPARAQQDPVSTARQAPIFYSQATPYPQTQDPPAVRWESGGVREDSFGDARQQSGSRAINAYLANNLQQDMQEEGSQSQPNAALIAQGRAAFSTSCVDCHDADRSLEKSKSYSAWLTTVRRMAAKSGADVASGDIVPIATFLASLSEPTGESSESDSATQESAAADDVNPLSINGTISPIWRGTNGEQRLENPGFFVDAWLTASWQPEGAVSATATACTSCHSDRSQNLGFTMELVEASASLNLNKLWCNGSDVCVFGGMWSTNITAGRFIVPFGAFSRMSNPAVLRTVTNPLMFNMGRRLGSITDQPVLPGPYSDEGVDVSVSGRFGEKFTTTLDVFAVNGLQQQGLGINFTQSRRYVDNNREPAVGFRTTVGTNSLRFGGSLMSGTAQPDGGPQFDYRVSGLDAVFRLRDYARFYVEYAIRTDDSLFVPGDQNHTYGIVIEGEVDIPCTNDFSFLVRYDTLEHRDAFFGPQTQERVTWGLNKLLPGGSLLIFNHEHWLFATEDADVVALRWSATF